MFAAVSDRGPRRRRTAASAPGARPATNWPTAIDATDAARTRHDLDLDLETADLSTSRRPPDGRGPDTIVEPKGLGDQPDFAVRRG